MPRTNEQFKKIKDERKASILSAALYIFAQANGERVSIDQICSKANCSHGLVYHYFSNVDDVYSSLIKSDVIRELDQCLKIDKNVKAIESIYKIISKFEEVLSNSENVPFVLLFLNKNEFKSTLINLIKSGQKDKDVSSGNPEDIFKTCYYIYKGFCFDKLSKQNLKEKLPDKDVIFELFKRGKLL